MKNASIVTPDGGLRSDSGAAGLFDLLIVFSNLIFAPVRMFIGAWHTFFYTPADPAVLSFIRVLSGGMLLYTHIVWGLNLPAFLGSAGWNSPEVVAAVTEGRLAPSFWWYVPDSAMLSVHCLCLAILSLYWIGFATRITSILSMAITISYSYRAHMSNFGLDQINAILTLYMCIGPSGAALSVDRCLAVYKAKRKAAAAGQLFVMPPLPKSVSANLAIRLIQLHFCVIYTYAGLSKLQGDAWWSGEAVWLAFANLEYQSVDMTWVAWYPWISDLMTHSTIIWEVSFAAAVWVRPLRPYVLFVGFLLHAGIGGMMGMWTFALIMIFGHVSFWQNDQVRWILAKLPFQNILLGPAPIRRLSAAAVTATTGLLARAASSIRPAVLVVSPEAKQRSMCFSYFWKRGFPCVALRNRLEAREAQSVMPAAATVYLGTDMQDEEITEFHDEHFRASSDRPLLMVLTEEQSVRLNGRIHTPRSIVLTGKVSLGTLRREIEDVLLASKISSVDLQADESVGVN